MTAKIQAFGHENTTTVWVGRKTVQTVKRKSWIQKGRADLAVHTSCRSRGWCRSAPSARWVLALPGTRRSPHRSARQAATARWCWWRATCPPSTNRTRWFSSVPPTACTDGNTQKGFTAFRFGHPSAPKSPVKRPWKGLAWALQFHQIHEKRLYHRNLLF